MGPQITPVLQALEQRLQALVPNATNATNEIPAVAADTEEPAAATATAAATPPAATPTARP